MLDLSVLNPQQRLAVETLRGPVLILAGAGTGKTRVITFRIAHLIERGVAPGNILAVTFTNKAAREMRERVTKLIPHRLRRREKLARAHAGNDPLNRDIFPLTRPLPSVGATLSPEAGGEGPGGERFKEKGKRQKADGPTIATFHSLGARILREHIEVLGYKPNFVIYDEAEQLGAIKKILSQISTKGENADPKAVLALLSRFKNAGPDAAAFADPNVRALAQHVRPKYESALHACNAIDFDDLLLLTLRLFEEHPGVLQACREKYRFVMVDEYQDTNAAQFRLVKLLCEQHRNLCVVGDDDQSIYGWRGAEISNLLDLEQHFGEVRVIKLEQNYRSTNTILNAANAVIKNNARRRGKHLWSEKGDGQLILLHEFESDEAEARTIVEEIEFARAGKRIPWGAQAILFRTNLQARPLEMAFRQANVRYHLIGGQSYFDRREVRDFLAYLKVFINPHDDISLLRIANVPARGLSDVTMERLLAASQERQCSVYAAMRHTDVQAGLASRTRERLQAFLEFVERVRGELQGEGEFLVQGWAQRFLDETGYIADLKRSEKNLETAENRVRNLRELMVELDADPTLRPTERLQVFLEDLTLDSEREEDSEAQGDAVTLITMHSCKGLEFPHVYVVGLEDGLLPHSRSKVEGTLDEERRLFYVAITRAMQTLTLSYCLGRKKYGEMTPCHPSPFLRELPPDLVENAAERAKAPVAAGEGKDRFAAMRAALG